MSALELDARSVPQRWVLAWVDRYTRGVSEAAASERRDELVSDLWEQRAAARDSKRPSLTTALSILSRTVRGIPADLAWRRAQLAGRPLQPVGARFANWMEPAGLAFAVIVGLAIALMGAVAVGRVVMVVARHQFPPSNLTIVSTALGTAAVVCGLLLLRRPRTRWMGAIWLAASGAIVLYFAGVALVTVSATAEWFANTVLLYPMMPIAQPVVLAALAAVSLFYLALAVAWIPRREVTR